MKYLAMLGKELKSDDVIELLETYEIEVIYEFDRLRENTPDQYWATCLELGMQLEFDENQVLSTIFLFLTEERGFTPADLRDSDIPVFGSKDDVRHFATESGIATTEGEVECFGTEHDWIRLDFPGYSVHYDFGGGLLKQVTLALTEKQ